MINLSDELIQAERREEMRRRADRHRLIVSVTSAGPRAPRRLDAALNRLGGLLITWGCRLQRRYDHILQASTERGPAIPFSSGGLAAGGGGNRPAC